MPRGNGLYRVVPLVALVASLTLTSCRVFDFEQREPWRAEAEEKCLAEKIVQPSAYIEPESSIEGRGVCGMVHPFKVAALDGGMVEVSPKATLACPIIGEVDRWIANSVQPAAMTWFGEQVAEIKQISAYSCRGMNGQPGAHISEHAFGNALDVAAFKLQSGREIVIKNAWNNGSYEERGFLRDVAMDACQNFTTVLAPGSNRYHYDHIHIDLSRRASGNTYCKPQVARLTPPSRNYARAPQRMPQVAQAPAYGPSVIRAENYGERRYNDLPLGTRPPEYAPRQAARASYPQAGGQPMDLHAPQPSYANPPMQAAPSYAPAYAAPEPVYRASDPYRPLPPRNVGARLKRNDEIMTGSIGKHAEKKSPHPKRAQKAPSTSKPMTNADIFSPVPISSQGAPTRSQSIGDATLKALKAN
ncbi:MAG TPA: extensin family protein [Xanthobacteraceae bacterium]|nr:extensin family protein [Xanthobacteraceae bacterium]